MTIEQAIRERLLSLVPVTTVFSTRIYMLSLRQNATLPAVRVQKIGGDRVMQHLRGGINLLESRIQVDLFFSEQAAANPYAEAMAAADAVHGDGLGTNATGLWGFIGDLGGSPATLRVRNIQRALGPEPSFEGEERRLVRVQQDFMTLWSRIA